MSSLAGLEHMLVSAAPNTLNSSSLGVTPSWLKANVPCRLATDTNEASPSSNHCASTSFSPTVCVVAIGSASAVCGSPAAAPNAPAAPIMSSAPPATPPAIFLGV